MDLTQIRYFLALSKTLNFTRAADACNVTQPALTRSIQRLEDEMGGPLILRERGQTQLTELGRSVLPILQQTADAAESARQLARDFHKPRTMPLRLGVEPPVDTGSLTPLLRELARRMPALELTVRQGSAAEISAWLLACEIDVGFTADCGQLTARANHWPLFEDGVVVLLPEGHALAQGGPVDAARLADEPCVGRAGDTPLDRIHARLAGAGEELRHRAATQAQVVDIVLAGLGVGLSTERQPQHPGIQRRTLTPPERLTVSVAAIPGRPASQAAQLFLKMARARCWDLAEVPPGLNAPV